MKSPKLWFSETKCLKKIIEKCFILNTNSCTVKLRIKTVTPDIVSC